jgi:hypothetical protein
MVWLVFKESWDVQDENSFPFSMMGQTGPRLLEKGDGLQTSVGPLVKLGEKSLYFGIFLYGLGACNSGF